MKKPRNFDIHGFRAFFRVGFAALMLVSSLDFLIAIEVDREELNKGGSNPVVFINYEGPHARIETRSQIRNIGFFQGSAIQGGLVRTGELGRYFVIHSVTGPEANRIDADIFGLGVDVGVDHIRNLRLIIQGYLEGAYSYSPQDAALLAEYITIYNAVFRGNWNYFSTRYKGPVVQHLLPERAGLSIRFDEWPGQTLMLIPLALGTSGALSAVDTTSLTSPQVIEEMRKADDRGVERRRDMVDLKERESDEAEQRATLQREAITDEESRIAQERTAVAADRNAVAQERAAATAEQDSIAREREQARADEAAGRTTAEEARAIEEDLDRREAQAEERNEELDRREAQAEERDTDLDRREEALEDRREEAQKAEDFAEQKLAEAQQERQEIAQDQQEIINQEDRRGPAPVGLIGVRIAGADSPLGRIVRLNAATSEELNASPLNTVNARTLMRLGGRIIAIAGENRGNGAIRLVEISPDTLEMTRQGGDDIHPQSLLWVNGESLYAITSSGGGFYFARFNADLVREAQSDITVHPHGTPIFEEDGIIIQRSDGRAAILNTGDLSERK